MFKLIQILKKLRSLMLFNDNLSQNEIENIKNGIAKMWIKRNEIQGRTQ